MHPKTILHHWLETISMQLKRVIQVNVPKYIINGSGNSFVLYLSRRKYNRRIATIRTTTKPQKNSTTPNGNYAKLYETMR